MNYISQLQILSISPLIVENLESENDKLLQTIGLNIRKARNLARLSQGQLAFEAGLTREFINKVESGRLNISILKLQSIASVLNVPVKSFFD